MSGDKDGNALRERALVRCIKDRIRFVNSGLRPSHLIVIIATDPEVETKMQQNLPAAGCQGTHHHAGGAEPGTIPTAFLLPVRSTERGIVDRDTCPRNMN